VVQVAQYYTSRILAPIDYAAMGYADEKALTSNYLTGFEGIRFAGQLYGLPTEVSNYACYLNNAIWKAAGLDPNRDFPKTWEEMPAIAEKLTIRDRNGVPRRRGFDFDWPSLPAYWLTLNTMMHQRGVNLFDEAGYKATFDGPDALIVMQYLVDWVNKYKLGGPQYTDTRTDFLAGNLATDCSFGIWGIPQMHDAKLDYSVKPLPRFADGKNGGMEVGTVLHRSRGRIVHRRRIVRAAARRDGEDQRRRQPGVPDRTEESEIRAPGRWLQSDR
jgi:multiple sugar transport system substrate-binding protein